MCKDKIPNTSGSMGKAIFSFNKHKSGESPPPAAKKTEDKKIAIHFFREHDKGISLEDAYTSALVSLGVPKEYACYGRARGNIPPK